MAPWGPREEGEALYLSVSHGGHNTRKTLEGYQASTTLSLHLADCQWWVAVMKYLGDMMGKRNFRCLPGRTGVASGGLGKGHVFFHTLLRCRDTFLNGLLPLQLVYLPTPSMETRSTGGETICTSLYSVLGCHLLLL